MTETKSRTVEPGAEMAWERDVSGPENAASAYQRHLVPGLFRPCAEELIDAATPGSEDRVLDVGCGTGVVALLAAEKVGRSGAVSGVDLNPGMLKVARSLPGADAVDWRQGDAAQLPYGDASFDLAYCQHTLQFLQDRAGALREMHRVLAPGGRAAIAVWGPVDRSPGYVVLGAALTRHVAPEAGAAVTRGPFALSDPEPLVSLLEETSFTKVEMRVVDMRTRFPSAAEFLAGTLPLTAAVVPAAARMDDDQKRALTEEVTAGLEPFQEDGAGLAFPMQAHLATGVAS